MQRKILAFEEAYKLKFRWLSKFIIIGSYNGGRIILSPIVSGSSTFEFFANLPIFVPHP
ncbi:MAG: hypothetical protein GW789_00055 [Ignavibacteria bacterium]|nr:hypothetical protein [Ignavibacteria bacterium]